MPEKTVQDTLAEREQQHGPFSTHAEIEILFRDILWKYRSASLTNVQYVGLSMILHKIARILNRGNNHVDTWHDIAGYATLVEKSMLDEQMES